MPRLRQFVLQNSRKVLQRRSSRFTLRPRQNGFSGIETVSLLHRALSGTIFANFVFGRTSRAHFAMVQACRRAACCKPDSGFTANGFPTLASIHWSCALSPYTLHFAKFNFHFSAYHHTATAFASPNIGRPSTRPVQRPSFSSSRVAHTWISAARFLFASSPRSRFAIPSARNSSVPVTSTIRSPFAACLATHSIASRQEGASFPARLARRPLARTARRYALFPCNAWVRPFGSNRANSTSHAIPFRKETFPSLRSARKYLRSSDGISVSVPSTSKKAARFMPFPLPFPSYAPELPLCAPDISSLQSTPADRARRKTPPSPRSIRAPASGWPWARSRRRCRAAPPARG